ncbi:unnamed protein product [Protopolystoma xenopodis]|uniref:Uncharacterized protein n=1 Tax=Protopolystoma xenopodis TaxID=117903 RepID=A0A3S5B8Y9_9PLAT|nr:unnamed protein product [Protopolystoma xenopodis]
MIAEGTPTLSSGRSDRLLQSFWQAAVEDKMKLETVLKRPPPLAPLGHHPRLSLCLGVHLTLIGRPRRHNSPPPSGSPSTLTPAQLQHRWVVEAGEKPG